MFRHMRNTQIGVALVTLLFCAYVTATPAITTTTTSSSNYNCPEDCHCVLSQNTHTPFLHAKCTSLIGLKSETPLKATLPIHSIDLSYLRLPRLAHSLDKLHNLTSIDLSHNELHEIGHLGRRIKKLNLKHNRLTSAKLTKLPQHVQELNLQHNDISYLPLEMTKLSNLHKLELSHNDINCSCETLEVRNWLQERHVFTEHPVVCSYPAETKGKPWLQIKQSDICDKEKRGWFDKDDDNYLMSADQPVEGSGDIDDLGNLYMPIENKSQKSNEINKFDDVEGSGDLSKMGPEMFRVQPIHDEIIKESPAEKEEEEANLESSGDGSGDDGLIIPNISRVQLLPDDLEPPVSEQSEKGEDVVDNEPIPEPEEETISPDIFKNNDMGIFEGKDDVDTKNTGEQINEPAVHHETTADVVTDAPIDGNSEESAGILTAKVAKKDDSNATYFLLGVIGLIVVGLILFVGIKRCKSQRTAAQDAEAQRQTELLDMDKKNPGKPIQRNGNEHVPLIGEKSKIDQAKPINGAGKKAYDSNDTKDGNGQQPLLNNGNGTNTNGNTKEADIAPTDPAAHEYHPISPRYPTPQSPRASKYAQHPQAAVAEQNNNNPDESYLPSSPKSGRYSPVYATETGRVKIKLTETPRPKTPMLVTRSKSNAGDIITTPVRGGYLDAPPAVHQVPIVGGVGGAANGHVNH